jgi:DNA-binding PadR family transcriptional regulator
MTRTPALAVPGTSLGRYVEAALWVLIALDGDPLGLPAMFDTARSLDGPIGHGTFIGALSRLERLRLVESTLSDSRATMYRLTTLGRVAAGSASILNGVRGQA